MYFLMIRHLILMTGRGVEQVFVELFVII